MTIKEYLDSFGATIEYVVIPPKSHLKDEKPMYTFTIQADIPFDVNSKTVTLSHVTARFTHFVCADDYDQGIFRLEEYLKEEFKGDIKDIAVITFDSVSLDGFSLEDLSDLFDTDEDDLKSAYTQAWYKHKLEINENEPSVVSESSINGISDIKPYSWK